MNFFTKHKIALLFIIGVLVVGGFVVYRNYFQKPEAPRYVLASVEKGTLIVSVTGSGNLAAFETADVSPGISGTVSDMKVALGDKVQKGQTLATIKNDELDILRDSALSSLNIAKSAVDKAKLDKLDAQEKLTDLQDKDKSDPASVSDLEIKQAKQKVTDAGLAITAAEVKVRSATLTHNEAKTDADNRTVKSPIEGRVTELNIKKGDTIGQGASSSANAQTSALIIVSNTDKLLADVSLNEVDAAKVQTGQKTTLTFDAVEGLTMTGSVSSIDSLGTVTQGVVTYNAHILLDGSEPRIKPGMSTTAAIVTDVRQDVLLVPNSAVKTQGDAYYVEIVDAPVAQPSATGVELPSVPRAQTVQTGLSNDTSTEILSGLKEGDQIVVRTITSASQTPATQTPNLFGGGSAGAATGIRIPR